MARGFCVGLLGICLVCVAPAPGFAQLKIGVLAELTGGAASYGASLNVGYHLGIKEVNEAGGVLGQQVELVVTDDQSDPTQAVSEVRRLIQQEKVHALLGPALSL